MNGLGAFVLLNLFEFFGIILWLQLVDAGQGILGILILIAGLFLERFIVYVLMIRPAGWTNTELFARRFITQAVRETGIWVGWVVLADQVSIVLAFVFLFITMLLEHGVDVAEQNEKPRFFYLTNPEMLFLTFVEAFGASLWLYFVRDGQVALGTGIMLVTFIIEHIFQGHMVEIKPAPAATTS